MPIPINLDRYAPQGQTGGGASSIASAQLFQTGMFAARAMSQSGQAMQGAMGDLATGLRDVSGAVKAYQKQQDDAMTLADESGGAAFLAGSLNEAQLKIKQATTLDDVDKIAENHKAGVGDYAAGKDESGTANLRTRDGQLAFGRRNQMFNVSLSAAAKERKAELETASSIAKHKSLGIQAQETGVTDYPAGRLATNTNIDNMVKVKLLPPGEPAELARKQALAEGAIYRTQFYLDGLAQAKDESDLKDRKAAALTSLDEVKDDLPRGKLTEYQNQIDALALGVDGKIKKQRNDAENQVESAYHTRFADLVAGGMQPDQVAQFKGDLARDRNKSGVSLEHEDKLATMHLSLVTLEKEQAKEYAGAVEKRNAQEEKTVVDSYGYLVEALKIQAQSNPTEIPAIKVRLTGLQTKAESERGLTIGAHGSILGKVGAALKEIDSPSAISPAEAQANKVIATLIPSGMLLPKALRDKTETVRTKAMGDLNVAQKAASGDYQERRLAEIISFKKDWFADAKTRGLEYDKFKVALDKKLSELYTIELNQRQR